MKKKNLAVPATAPAPISADPFRELLDIIPGDTVIFGAKAHRVNGKSEVRVAYLENGRINFATCNFTEVVAGSVSAEVETLSCKWKGGAA